jgi:hypothetical protein
MLDAIDDLIAYRRPHGISPMMERVYRFHKVKPQVLDFLVQELRDAGASGWPRASLASLWHYARWVLTQKYRVPGESFVMDQNLATHYGRIVVILHPDLNGFFEMKKSTQADADLGIRLEPSCPGHKRGYIRRLLWADGQPIENGWRPANPHEPKPVSRRERVRRVA